MFEIQSVDLDKKITSRRLVPSETGNRIQCWIEFCMQSRDKPWNIVEPKVCVTKFNSCSTSCTPVNMALNPFLSPSSLVLSHFRLPKASISAQFVAQMSSPTGSLAREIISCGTVLIGRFKQRLNNSFRRSFR